MKINLTIDHQQFSADFSDGKSISITLSPNGEQPNHFGVSDCTSEPVVAGSFIGDTKQGGSCNANVISLIPHCNGTHTESVSHIVNDLLPVHIAIEQSLFPAAVISVRMDHEHEDGYQPISEKTDKIIQKKQIEMALNGIDLKSLTGLVIRTLPNTGSKLTMCYGEDNFPPYISNEAMDYIVEKGFQHLMVDFPSVDRMYDDGALTNHRKFWNVAEGVVKLSAGSTTNKTITEMIFVEDNIEDGLYLCNLQVPEIETDAVPSRPVLYALEKI